MVNKRFFNIYTHRAEIYFAYRNFQNSCRNYMTELVREYQSDCAERKVSSVCNYNKGKHCNEKKIYFYFAVKNAKLYGISSPRKSFGFMPTPTSIIIVFGLVL